MSVSSPDDILKARAATYIYGEFVQLRRNGAWMVGKCPFHPDRRPSFGVRDGTWICFAGCGRGDAIEFIMRTRGLDFPAAVRELIGYSPCEPPVVGRREPGRDDLLSRPAVIPPSVMGLWESANDPVVAEHYLVSRGIRVRPRPLPAALRGHKSVLYSEECGAEKPAVAEPWRAWWSDKTQTWWQGIYKPAMIAAVTDSQGRVTAIQRTWAERQYVYDSYRGPEAKGTRCAWLKVSKKSLGRMGAGAVRLSEPGPTLGLAEGVEDSLSASEIYSLPVWAVCGASRLGSIEIPECVEAIKIFADNGSAGEKAAAAAEKTYLRRGYAIEVLFPESGHDWNSFLMAQVGMLK
jgi:Toprim domain/CHC2 zinc finger